MRLETWIGGLLAFAAAVCLSACKPISLKGDPAAEAAAHAAYEDIAAGRVTAVQARLTPEAAKMVTPAQILDMRAYTPAGAPSQRRLVGIDMLGSASGPQTQNLTYELTYPDVSVLYRVALKRPGAAAPWGVEGVNLNRETNAELAKGRFTLTGRSPAQLLFLLATILSPLLMLSAIVAVVRAPRLKRKWLWCLLALVGAGTATMNWATGEADLQIAVNLIGAGVTKQGYSGFFPWMLKFTLPVGALAALWRAAKARREARIALAVDETSDAA